MNLHPLDRRTGRRFVVAWLTFCLGWTGLWAGLGRELQNYYTEKFKNRALYLKVPVHGFRQVIKVGNQPELDRSNLGQPVAFKVGDQVRILELSFKNDFIRFKVAAVDLSRESEIVFEFPSPITEDFPQGRWFDAALDFTFTAGTDYKEIDAAKVDFIADQFDQLINQFAVTTGTSREYVIQTISEKNPEFERSKRLLRQRDAEAAELRRQLESQAAAQRAGERNLESLRRQLSDAETAADSLKEERGVLLDERADLKDRLQKLEADSEAWQRQRREYDSRIAELAQGLDVKTSSNTELNSRVTNLGQAIDQMKQSNLELTKQYEELKQKHQEQTAALAATESERNKLAADLKALTSDRKSLNSRFLETRRKADALETALELAAGLTVQQGAGSVDGASVSEVRLLGRRVGTLTVEPPSAAPFTVRFETVSPDTVEFNEQERRLWSALQASSEVGARWTSADPAVAPELVGEGERKPFAAREAALWTYQLPADPSGPLPLRLQVSLFDGEGREVPLAGLEYTARPGGFAGLIPAGSSWLWLAVGLVLGAAGAAVIVSRRGRRSSAVAAARTEAAMKRL